MTIPFWCLFAAVLLPYVWFSFAAPFRAAQFGKALDLRTPRLQDPALAGRAARAQGAHQNSLEALAYFAPAVLVAHLAHADAAWSARLSVAFIVFRLVHGAVYMGDRPPLRTAFFALGLLTSLALFVLAACA
ncbi:MAG TPA: MAPEG family protein [Polyangiaceae bacterium]